MFTAFQSMNKYEKIHDVCRELQYVCKKRTNHSIIITGYLKKRHILSLKKIKNNSLDLKSKKKHYNVSK